MPEAVLEANEVSLNAIRYKITGPVQRSLSSVYPGKTVFGDYTKDSSPNLSILALSDHRGGIGQEVYHGEEIDGPANRSWYSTADTRFKGHLILPPLVTNTGNLPAGLTSTTHLMAYKGRIIQSANATTDGVYEYTPGTDTWGSSLLNFADPPTGTSNRWTIADINNGSYLMWGSEGRYFYYEGTTWSQRIVASTGGFMAALNGRVWGALTTPSPYKLWYTFTPGSAETQIGNTPLLRQTVRVGQLFVAKDVSGERTLYLALPTGLYIYDFGNDEWIETGLQLPDSAGAAAANFASGIVWRDEIYFSTRSSIFKYSLVGDEARISQIGPDRDHGLPSAKASIVRAMVPSLNDIIVSLVEASKTAVIMAWNGQGWRVLYEGTAAGGQELAPILVAATSGTYRLWFANATTSPFNIAYLDLPSALVNPLQITTYAYAAAATHDWPWFTAGQSDVTKIAVRVKVEVSGASANETVTLSYATNFTETFTEFAAITTNGITSFSFPDSTTPTGTAFRSIRFRVALARGGTNTNTPDVRSVTLEYYKKLDPKWQFQVEIDVNGDNKGRTPKELRAALLTAQESGPLVEFTYRDPDANTDATFWVQVRPIIGVEQTGFDERGTLSLALVEV